MSSPRRARGPAADKAAQSSGTVAAAGAHLGPDTPEVFHPAAAAAAHLSTAARSAAGAAAAGLTATRGGGLQLPKQVQGEAGSPAGPFGSHSRAHGEIEAAEDDAAVSPTAAVMHARLASDTGLAGMAAAAGQAWDDLTTLPGWPRRVRLVRGAAATLLVASLAYAFLVAPNYLGLRHDLALLLRLFYDNALTFVLFNLLGLFPFIINCLMWPAFRSRGLKPTMWPHLVLSYVTGSFAVLSYLARWRPQQTRRGSRMPPTRLAGDHLWLQRQHEGRLMPAVVTSSIATLLALCLAASPATWAHFGVLFTHSRAVHVMTLDLTLLILMSPWLVVADARARGVRLAQNPIGRFLLGLAMLAVPMVGPGLYLLVRPVAASGRGRSRLPGWTSLVWPFKRGVTAGAAGAKAAVRGARGRLNRAGRQLRDRAAATDVAAASGRAAAAASTAATDVAAAAAVPLPNEHALGSAAARAAAGAAQLVHGAAGAAAGWVQHAWGGMRRQAGRLLSGRSSQHDTTAGAAADDEAFAGYHSVDGDAGGTDISDATEHQQHPFSAHNALGRFAYFITGVAPGGGHEMLFADDYNETEAQYGAGPDSDTDALVDSDDGEEDDDSDSLLASGSEGDDEADDVTYKGAAGAESDDEGVEQHGVRHGPYRLAKAIALQRLAELAHKEHPRVA